MTLQRGRKASSLRRAELVGSNLVSSSWNRNPWVRGKKKNQRGVDLPNLEGRRLRGGKTRETGRDIELLLLNQARTTRLWRRDSFSASNQNLVKCLACLGGGKRGDTITFRRSTGIELSLALPSSGGGGGSSSFLSEDSYDRITN